MTVKFKDVEFGCFEPHFEIEYEGKKYRAIEVRVTLSNGQQEIHTIAEKEYGNALARDDEKWDNSDLDNEISYYADNNDGVYYILETITGEAID